MFQKDLSYSNKLKAESVRAVMFNTKSFLIQSFWQAANERECIAGRGGGARKKLTASLCLCCHSLLNIQLWAWKLCGPKVNKVELCQLTLLHAEQMWQCWSQNPDNTNCWSNLEHWAVMANCRPPSPASQQQVALGGEGGTLFATHFQSTRTNCNKAFQA
jgi:hypothetical protein